MAAPFTQCVQATADELDLTDFRFTHAARLALGTVPRASKPPHAHSVKWPSARVVP